MSRINTNINSLIAQRTLSTQNMNLTKSLERLSTGLAINRGADNPAGLIASEKLRSEKTAISTAIGNAERADQISNIAEGGLQEIQSMLTELQGLVGENANKAGLSQAEKEANQLQVDSIIQTIDRIASTTSFAGTKLLNGGYDFTVTGVNAAVADYSVNAAKINFGSSQGVNVLITASAQRGGLIVSLGGALDLSASTANFTFEVAGVQGSRQFSFASGTRISAVAAAINTYKSVTGVSAKTSGATSTMYIKSTEFGSDQFVSFKLVNRGGQTAGGGVVAVSSTNENVRGAALTAWTSVNEVRDSGRDIAAVINGVTAKGKGKTAAINNDLLDVSLEFTTAAAQITGGTNSINALTVTGGGAKFHLGPTVDINNQVALGIRNVAARNLGNKTTGYLSDLVGGKSTDILSGNPETSQKIVDKAIEQVSQLRGRLGSFQKNIVGSTINALNIALENTSAAESVIRDTNFAKETANLTRNQILVQAASSVLSTANSQPQAVLGLLR